MSNTDNIIDVNISRAIDNLKLFHGLLIDNDGVHHASKCVAEIKGSLLIEESQVTTPSVKLINTYKIQDTFKFVHNLKADDESYLINPPKAFVPLKEDNPLFDKRLEKAVIFRIDKELRSFSYTNVEPTDKFVSAVST